MRNLASELNLLQILSSSLTPTTLAAVIEDLEDNNQLTPEDEALASQALHQFKLQLSCLVGCRCPGCGEQDQDKLVWQDDETVLCDCGCKFVP
jgi:hypothetical protein